MTEPAILALEDGTVFEGRSVGVPGKTVGEVVFNTAMTGYQEILNDPSYFRQLVTLTCPHIGNVGTNCADLESPRVHVAGLIVRDLSMAVSNWRSETTLAEYLRRGNTVAIADIDTRKLTRILRDKGAQDGCILAGAAARADPPGSRRRRSGLPRTQGYGLVTTGAPYQWDEGGVWPRREEGARRNAAFHVVAYDFGVKRNILRRLAEARCRMTVVPAATPAAEVMALRPGRCLPLQRTGGPRAVPVRHRCDRRVDGSGSADVRYLPGAISSWRWPAAPVP